MKWPIAIDEPDPISHSPTPTSSIANSEHSGRDPTNNETAFAESDIYNRNETTSTANIDPYVNDESVIQANSEFSSRVDSAGLNDFDFVQVPRAVMVQNPEESLESQNINDNISQPPNLNPNVPEFVPTFAHGSCAESLNYDKKLEDNSDIEGIYTLTLF